MNDEVDLVVRCELDGVMNYKGQDQLLSIKALNEFDPKLTGAHLSSSGHILVPPKFCPILSKASSFMIAHCILCILAPNLIP